MLADLARIVMRLVHLSTIILGFDEKRLGIVGRRKVQEVLGLKSANFKRVIHPRSASAGARLWRESPRQLYGSSAPVKVVRNRDDAARRVFVLRLHR